VTSTTIENLRVMHRLKVVQSLEDGNEKNIVRSLVSDNYFSSDELMVCIFSKKYQNYAMYLVIVYEFIF
jgi:hypothetical protein